MRNFILSTFLLVIGSAFAQEYTTDYEIQYEAKYSLDSLNLNMKTTETLYLFAGLDYGVFMNFNAVNKERIEAEVTKRLKSGNMDFTGLAKPSNINVQFYKNRQEDEVFAASGNFDKIYIYEEVSVPLEWEIIDETKEYLNYQVQKATTSFAGRDYEAWFTLEIPINDGPYVFYGLPGLIVELYDTKGHYYFGLKSIEKLESSRTWELNLDKVYSREEVKKIEAKANKSLLLPHLSTPEADGDKVILRKFLDETGKEISEAELRREHKKIRESKNNPIELE